MPAAGLAPAGPVVVVDRNRVLVAGEERRLNVAVRADPCRAARSCRADPDRRMRLLVRPRPDIDVAVMEEAAFVAERSIVRGSRP